MTVRIDLNLLCEKCLIAAWERPVEEMAMLGYFMFAAKQELIEAGNLSPSIADIMPVALTAAVEFMLALNTETARSLTDMRIEAECLIADMSSPEALFAAADRVLEHVDAKPYINVPKQLIN